jgi:branched-chain amino acid transport system substrate-binding protein
MAFSRRQFIASTSGAAAGIALPFHAFGQGAAIKLGSVLDNSGNLDAYGKPMVLATVLAAEEINADGGLLGRKIQVIQYDTQSDIALYTKYAQQLARDDKVDVVHGGITSASREAIRQTFRRANILYFYNVLYEGGVCDRNCFVTGTTPAQAVEPIVEISQKQWGRRSTCWPRTTTTARSPPSGSRTTSSSVAARCCRPTSSRSTSPTSARRSPRSSAPSPILCARR